MNIRSLAPADVAFATLLLLILVLFTFRAPTMVEEPGFTVRSEVKPELDLQRDGSVLEGLRVNPNRADAQRLTALPGVGPALAETIVQFREVHGPFGRLGDLREVPGIGAKRLQKMRPYLTLEEEARWSTK